MAHCPKWAKVAFRKVRGPVSFVASIMPNYHPLIARAVSRLENNTPAARHAVFERARVILIDQLRIRQPPASDSEITRERAALEDAIRKVELEPASPISRPGSEQARRDTCNESPFPIFERRAIANKAPRGAAAFSKPHDAVVELTKTPASLDSHPGPRVGEQNTRALQALYERARVILVDQLRIQQPTASDSEIVRRRTTPQDADRKVELESTTPPVPHTGPAQALSARSNEGGISGIPEQKTPADGPPRGPTTFKEDDRPANELTETTNASILTNLRGIQWLDQLILDGTNPLASDSLQQDARTVLKWLSVGETETIRTKHYDQFGRAIQSYIMEGQASPAAVQSLNLALNDDIRGVFSRLLDREQAATIFDEALTSFANVWIALIVVLNFICIIGLVVSVPTLWTGIAKLSAFYSPLNGWNWIAELVALSPALGAIAWRDRRLKRPWGAALLKLDFSGPKRLARAWRGPVST